MGFPNEVERVFTWIAVIVSTMICGVSLLTFASSMAPDLATSNAIGTIMLMLAMMFNGFFVAKENTPVVFRWIPDISFLGFGQEAACAVILDGVTIECTAETTPLGCITSGTDVLRAAGFDPKSVWANVGWMWLETAVLRFLSYFALHFLYTGQTFAQRWRAFTEW